MKALTVQQPWAWAIVHGGKDVENRTQAWGYRGPLAIHAGLQGSKAGFRDERFAEAFNRVCGATATLEELRDSVAGPLVMGAFVGLVDLVDVHRADEGCCESAWGDRAYVEVRQLCDTEPRLIPSTVHLVLANPRPLADPIRCRGQLGLWTPPADVAAAITQQLEEA